MHLQESMNTFTKWFAEVFEILKTGSYTPAYHSPERQQVWRKQCTAIYKLFLLLKLENSFNQSITKWDICGCFTTQCLRFWEQWLKEIFACLSWELMEINVLFYGHHWGRPCLTQISILKKCNNVKCARRQRWKLLARSTQKLRNVTIARYEFEIKYCLALKIN